MARKTGFILRKRGIDAYGFLVMMTYGLTGMAFPSLAGLVDAVKAGMTREALHLRFTDNAVAYMKACLGFIVQQKIQDTVCIDARIVRHFRRILIVDSSSWEIPAGLKSVFPGCGGSGSPAGCKIQACYEYLRGALSFFDILPGNRPDSSWSVQLPSFASIGDLIITDLGYFCLKTLRQVAEHGAFFLSRFLVGTTLCDPASGRAIDLYTVLRSIPTNTFEMPVILGTKEQARVRCRLVCLRADDGTARKNKDNLTLAALRKRKHLPSAQRLFFCNWIIMVTNVPTDWLDPGMVRPLYSLRWQIELIFKQLKSVLTINKSNSAKEPRMLCELLGRMIVAILTHRIHAHVNNNLWNDSKQEISMDKIHKRIQERTFTFKDHLLVSAKKAARYLAFELSGFLNNCRKLTQKSRHSSLEFINSADPPIVLIVNMTALKGLS